MFHFFDTLTNTKGDSLPGWRAECVQYTDGITPITIYADENSTPIGDVSGVTNMAVADSEGNIDFYVAEGTYSVRYYNSEGVYQRTKRYVPMYGADSVGFYLDTDVTLAADSDTKIASQHAVKTYVDTEIAASTTSKYKGEIDCAANPAYPTGYPGDFYIVSELGAGKIGGGSGLAVQAGDVITCKQFNPGGSHATIGKKWNVTRGQYTVDETYGAGWNGSSIPASRNDVYDKIEALVAAVPGAYTDEMAQDAIGTILVDSATIDFTYDDATPAVTASVIASAVKPTESLIIAASDETTALTTGTSKVTFRMPYAFTLTAVRASLATAQTSGSIFTVDINEGGSSILSTKLTIDNTEKTSTTAATPAVISDTSLADDAEITIDIDQVGDGTAKGLKVVLIGART